MRTFLYYWHFCITSFSVPLTSFVGFSASFVFLYLRAIYFHYNDVLMSTMASKIASRTIVYSIVYSGVDKKTTKKHQSSASLAFVWGIHRWPVNFPHKGPVTRKIFPFDDVIMFLALPYLCTFLYQWPFHISRHLHQLKFLFDWPVCIT